MTTCPACGDPTEGFDTYLWCPRCGSTTKAAHITSECLTGRTIVTFPEDVKHPLDEEVKLVAKMARQIVAEQDAAIRAYDARNQLRPVHRPGL